MSIETRRGRVAYVLLNRPERRNALDAESLEGLCEGFSSLAEDPAVRVIVVRGAGRNFCAGADLGEVARADGIAARRRYFGGVATLIETMRRAPQPIIAEIEGYCLAGALGIVGAADLAYASGDAVFGLPEVQVGLFPMVVMAPLARLIGMRALSDLALSGRRTSAAEALSMGLLNAVAERADLSSVVEGKAEELARLSPAILALGKEALLQVREIPFGSALQYLRGMVTQVASTDDGQEGVRAFLEKRRPEFQGR